MSTETVTLENIVIHRGDKQNAEIRHALQNYLLQFVYGTKIQSVSGLTLQVKINDIVLLNLHGESYSEGHKAFWQSDAATVNAISQITTDCEAEVTLCFDLFQWFSETTVYGVRFWIDVLEKNVCNSVTYHGLEYYDTDPEIQIFHFENGKASYKGNEVTESEVADIPTWYTYNFELTLDTDTSFTEDQLEKLKIAAEKIKQLFGSEEPYDFDESEIHIFSSVTLKSEDVPMFRVFLEKALDLAEEADATVDLTAEFVPNDMDNFAALYFVVESKKVNTKFVRY